MILLMNRCYLIFHDLLHLLLLVEGFYLLLGVTRDFHKESEITLLLGSFQLVLLLEGIALLSKGGKEFLEEQEIFGRLIDFFFELIQGVMVEVSYPIDLDSVDDKQSLQYILILLIFMHRIRLDSVRLEEHFSRNLRFTLLRLLFFSHSRVESHDDVNNGISKEICDNYDDDQCEVLPFINYVLSPVALCSFLGVV